MERSWRNLRDRELHNLYLSSYIGRDIRLRLDTVLRTCIISHLPVLNLMNSCRNKAELFTALCCNDC